PNVLRVGTTENIFVECQDCTQDMTVSIKVLNFPTKATTLASTSVNLNQGNKYQALGKVKIPQSNFNKDPKMKQNVYLHAQFPGRLLEKVVLVSFQSGYIFIQTDKTLYTPNSKVNYRVFVVTPNIEPMVREDSTQTDTTISIEFQTPDGIILPHETVSPTSGIHSGSFKLTEMVSTGIWKVVVKFQSSPQESFTADFEVKEYVLPSFEVKLASVTSFFYVDTQKLTVQIKATYLFGKEVEGVAFVVFGIIDGDTKKSIPQSFQMVQARTDAPNILSERQASATMTVHPQIHKSNNFIHIVIYTAEVTMGETIKVNFFFGQSIWKDITYLILSRGQLVNFGRYQAKGQKLISHMLIISKEMLPSFRIVAYYHPSDDEVVSDSVWVDVDESCMGSLKLEPSRLTVSYEPRRMFGLRVTGDPGATVGLVAVDKGVYVLNNNTVLHRKRSGTL
ncbi:unnamed protein product, partial [Tetraodon nigroviridis]